IQQLEQLQPGVKCDRCLGEVNPANAASTIAVLRSDINANDTSIAEQTELLRSQVEAIGKLKQEVDGWANKVAMVKAKDREIGQRIFKNRQEIFGLEQVSKPEIDKDLAIIEQRIKDLEAQLTVRKSELDGPSPYDQILVDSAE